MPLWNRWIFLWKNGVYAILFAQFTVHIAEICTGCSVGENPMLVEAEFLHRVCLSNSLLKIQTCSELGSITSSADFFLIHCLTHLLFKPWFCKLFLNLLPSPVFSTVGKKNMFSWTLSLYQVVTWKKYLSVYLSIS